MRYPARAGSWLKGKLEGQRADEGWKLVRREDRRSSSRRESEVEPKERPKDAVSREVGSWSLAKAEGLIADVSRRIDSRQELEIGRPMEAEVGRRRSWRIYSRRKSVVDRRGNWRFNICRTASSS